MVLIMRRLALAALVIGVGIVSYGLWQVWQVHSENERLLANPCADALPTFYDACLGSPPSILVHSPWDSGSPWLVTGGLLLVVALLLSLFARRHAARGTEKLEVATP